MGGFTPSGPHEPIAEKARGPANLPIVPSNESASYYIVDATTKLVIGHMQRVPRIDEFFVVAAKEGPALLAKASHVVHRIGGTAPYGRVLVKPWAVGKADELWRRALDSPDPSVVVREGDNRVGRGHWFLEPG